MIFLNIQHDRVNLLDLTLSDGSMFYQVRYNLASTRNRIFSQTTLY